MGAILYKLDPRCGKTYNTFQACYNKLAYRAYNDSLGYLQDGNTPSKNELPDIDKTLNELGVNPEYNDVESCLYNLLSNAATRTDVSTKTLVDAVNLCLLHEGMYGVRDLCASAGFQPGVGWLQAPTLDRRTSSAFESNIFGEYAIYENISSKSALPNKMI